MLTQMESGLLINALPLIWKYGFVRRVGVWSMQEQGGGEKKAKMEWGTNERASNYMTDLASGSLWLNRAPFPILLHKAFIKSPPLSQSHHILLHLLWIFGRSVCGLYMCVTTQSWYSRGMLPAFCRVYISPQYWPRKRDAACVASVF